MTGCAEQCKDVYHLSGYVDLIYCDLGLKGYTSVVSFSEIISVL